MKKRSLTPAGNDGRDLAAALAPHRDAILSQLAQTWRMRAPKNTVMLGAPQRAVEAADSIGSVWFGWLENVTDLSAVRELAIDLVRQELAYTTASALVQSLATIVTNIAASDTRYEVAALKLVRQFSAAFLDQIATQHELLTQQEQEHLSVLLGASAEVGRAAASILDTDQLLREVVNLITDRFGFYYAAVFTLDHTGQYAVLREATGQAGEVLKNLNHKLDIHSQSMVGAVITSQRPRIAAEVGRDVPRFSNPLLPGTQSEIALPLSVGDRVLGALDVQSTEPRAFDETTVIVLQNMADQIAIALENARLFERAQANLHESQQIQANLARNQAQLADALKIARLAYWEYDVEHDLFLFNDQFFSLFHTTAEQHGGYQLSSAYYARHFVHPDDLAVVGAETEKALNSTGRHYSRQLEHRILYANGDVGYLAVNINIDRDENGKILRYYGANQDITERRQIELDLAQERNLLRTIIDTLPERIFAKDLESRFTLANASEVRLHGTSSFEELRGKNDFDFYPPELAQQYYNSERAILVEGQSLVGYEERSVDQDGNTRWNISTKVPLRDINQQIIGLVGMTRDITEMKKVEAALVEEGNRLRTLIDNLPHSVYIKDQNSRFLVNNLAHLRVIGVTSQEEVVGKNDFDFFDADMAGRSYADEQELMRVGKPLLNREETFLNRATRQLQYVSSTKVPLRNIQGEVVGFVGFTEDITERKQAEIEREQLLARQQYHTVQLQTAAEISRIATSILNSDQLLAEIVKLIAARFGFYHVAAFTVDESGRWAILRDATGEVGQQLKDRGQALAIRGQSLVGAAIRYRQPRIALDVGADAVKFNDPLLPDTHSEIALPLFVGDRVLGALDVHATTSAAFDESYAVLLQGLADQIAVALNTAEQYQREQAHVEQTNRLMQIVIDLSERTDRAGLQTRLVRSALALLDTDRAQFWLKSVSGLELKAVQSVRPGADQSLTISQELADRVCDTGLPLRLDSPPAQVGYASRITDVPFNAALSVPISWQGQITGVLSVMRSQPGRPFTQDDENSAQLLAAQAAAALENITLAEQQQHRAVQLQTAAEVSRASSSILQLEELLNTVVELVRDNFNLYYVGTFLLDEEAEWAYLRAGTGEAGRKMLQAGHRLRVDESSMIGWSIVHRQARIAVDVGTEATRFDNPLLPNTRSEMALPLISRERIIGAATIQSTRPAAFTPDDITTLQTMADQITIAAENARLFEQTQQSVQHMTILNEVMHTISQEIELEWMLESTYQGVRRLLPVDAFRVALYDRVTNRVSYPLIVGEGETHTEPASPINPYSRIGQVIQSAEPILENISREELAATPHGATDTADHTARLAASELVVPLRQGNQTIGALAVQSYQPAAYTRQHLNLLENVASQLSVAIVNADLLEQSRRAIEELNDLNRRLTGEAWQSYVQTRSADAVIWYANDSTLPQVRSEEAGQLLEGAIGMQHPADEDSISPEKGERLISVPITLRGQIIGALRFRAPADKWTAETQAMAASVASHLAQAAENTRLIEQTQRTAGREKQIAQAADKIHRASDLDEILQTAIEEISRITGSTDVGIQLGAASTLEPEHQHDHQSNGHGEPNQFEHASTLA